MLSQLALLGTISICGWVFLTAVVSASPWWRGLPMMLPALAAAVWSAGEAAIQIVATPHEVLLARRMVFAGAFALPFAWYWAGATIAGRPRWLPGRRTLVVLALPLAFSYSCLYWGEEYLLFADWTARPPVHGPLFWACMPVVWALTLYGTAAFYSATSRLGRSQPLRVFAVSLGSIMPLGVHVLSVTFGWGGHDPTPVGVGIGLGLIQLAFFDIGVNGFLPVARRDVIDQLPSAIIVADLHGIVLDANPEARRLLGDHGTLGRALGDVISDVRADTARDFEIEVGDVRGAVGAMGSFAVLTDRTGSRRAERQVLQTHKLQALGVLTAGIAHEVNNPLAFVQANLSALAELADGLRDPRVQQALPEKLVDLARDAPDIVAESLEGVSRISRLVRQLRSFARGEHVAAERGFVDLAEAAGKARILAGVGLAPGALHLVSRPAPRVFASEDDLVQVAVNLIVNALQASEGQRVDIEVEIAPLRGGVALTVRDRGPGIPGAVMPHLFDPFFTTKPPGQGVGLGLSLSFDLARRNGGTLEARNREGGGAEFELWLPAADETFAG